MARNRTLLALLALPLLASATPPAESALKDGVRVIVRSDSGGAERFTLTTRGFQIRSASRQPLVGISAAPDTLFFFGAGTIELASADPARPIVADIGALTQRTPMTRFSARTLKIERATPTGDWVVTDR